VARRSDRGTPCAGGTRRRARLTLLDTSTVSTPKRRAPLATAGLFFCANEFGQLSSPKAARVVADSAGSLRRNRQGTADSTVDSTCRRNKGMGKRGSIRIGSARTVPIDSGAILDRSDRRPAQWRCLVPHRGWEPPVQRTRKIPPPLCFVRRTGDAFCAISKRQQEIFPTCVFGARGRRSSSRRCPHRGIPRALSRVESLAIPLFLFHTHKPPQLIATAR